MNSDDKKELLKLLKQKKDCLQTILKMTKERKFNVVEEDVERFYNFFQKREVFFEKCRNIDNKISGYDISDDDKKSFFYKDVEKTESEIKEIIRQIIAIDEKNKVIMEELMRLIKDNIRNLKVSKQVSKGYNDFFYNESYGRFDSSN